MQICTCLAKVRWCNSSLIFEFKRFFKIWLSFPEFRHRKTPSNIHWKSPIHHAGYLFHQKPASSHSNLRGWSSAPTSMTRPRTAGCSRCRRSGRKSRCLGGTKFGAMDPDEYGGQDRRVQKRSTLASFCKKDTYLPSLSNSRKCVRCKAVEKNNCLWDFLIFSRNPEKTQNHE